MEKGGTLMQTHLSRLCVSALCALPLFALTGCGNINLRAKEASPNVKTADQRLKSNSDFTTDSRGQLLLKWTYAQAPEAFVVRRLPSGTRIPEAFARVLTTNASVAQTGGVWSLSIAAELSKKLTEGDCVVVSAQAFDGVETPPSSAACLESVNGGLQFFIDGE
jgi:hypothetical protein